MRVCSSWRVTASGPCWGQKVQNDEPAVSSPTIQFWFVSLLIILSSLWHRRANVRDEGSIFCDMRAKILNAILHPVEPFLNKLHLTTSPN